MTPRESPTLIGCHLRLGGRCQGGGGGSGSRRRGRGGRDETGSGEAAAAPGGAGAADAAAAAAGGRRCAGRRRHRAGSGAWGGGVVAAALEAATLEAATAPGGAGRGGGVTGRAAAGGGSLQPGSAAAPRGVAGAAEVPARPPAQQLPQPGAGVGLAAAGRAGRRAGSGGADPAGPGQWRGVSPAAASIPPGSIGRAGGRAPAALRGAGFGRGAPLPHAAPAPGWSSRPLFPFCIQASLGRRLHPRGAPGHGPPAGRALPKASPVAARPGAGAQGAGGAGFSASRCPDLVLLGSLWDLGASFASGGEFVQEAPSNLIFPEMGTALEQGVKLERGAGAEPVLILTVPGMGLSRKRTRERMLRKTEEGFLFLSTQSVLNWGSSGKGKWTRVFWWVKEMGTGVWSALLNPFALLRVAQVPGSLSSRSARATRTIAQLLTTSATPTRASRNGTTSGPGCR